MIYTVFFQNKKDAKDRFTLGFEVESEKELIEEVTLYLEECHLYDYKFCDYQPEDESEIKFEDMQYYFCLDADKYHVLQLHKKENNLLDFTYIKSYALIAPGKWKEFIDPVVKRKRLKNKKVADKDTPYRGGVYTDPLHTLTYLESVILKKGEN